MRKILVTFLVFFLLGSNVVSALDAVYPDEMSDNQQHTLDIADADQDQNEHACNHCCHGAAHFLGILHAGELVIDRTDTRHIASIALPRTSRAYQPPLPPPNA